MSLQDVISGIEQVAAGFPDLSPTILPFAHSKLCWFGCFVTALCSPNIPSVTLSRGLGVELSGLSVTFLSRHYSDQPIQVIQTRMRMTE